MNKTMRGGLFLILSSIGIAFFNYLLSIALSWQLEPAAFGMIGVSQSFIFLGTWFLIAGFPWVTAKTLARVSPTEYVTIYPILKGTLWGNLLLGLLLAGGLLLAFDMGWLPLGEAYRPLVRWVAIIIFLIATRMTFNAVLQGRLQFGQLALMRTIEVVIQFTTALLLVVKGYGATGALAGFAFGTACSWVVAFWFSRDLPFWQAEGFDKRTLSALRPAIPFLLANLSMVLLVNLDLLALKFLSHASVADEWVGHYQAATVLARIPYFVSQSVVAIIFPLIARHASDSLGANRAGRQALQLVVSLVLSLNILLMAAPESTIAFFFPPVYLSAAPTLRLLALSMTAIILLQTLTTILQARETMWLPALLLPFAVLSQLLAAWWLVPSYGLIGAALSSCIASFLALVAMWLATQHTFPTLTKLSWPHMAKQGAAFLLLAAIVASLPHLDRLMTAFWIALGMGCYGVSLLALRLIDRSTWTLLREEC